MTTSLTQVLAATMDPHNRRAAEEELKQRSVSDPHFLQSLLAIAREPSPIPDIEPHMNAPVRTAAIVYFKNCVKQSWNPSEAEHCLPDDQKQSIREVLGQILPEAHLEPGVRRVVSESIALICEVDFPAHWPQVVSTIVNILSHPTAMTVLEVALSTAHEIFKRYRTGTELVEVKTADELVYLNKHFVVPLLRTMQQLATMITDPNTKTADAQMACRVMGYAVEAMHDTTCLNLGEEYGKYYGEFMVVLQGLLQCQRADLLGDDLHGASLIEVKSLIVSCIAVQLRVSDDDVAPYIPGFMQEIWSTLRAPNALAESQDELIISCLNFVTMVCRSPCYSALKNPELMLSLCNDVIVPNLRMRDADLMLMLDNVDEYINRDIEGNESYTRRRSASDLISALIYSFGDQIGPHITNLVKQLVADNKDHSGTAPINTVSGATGTWLNVSLGITLYSALAMRGSAAGLQRGISANTALTSYISLELFFMETVVPLLKPSNPIPVPRSPASILACDAIRFVTYFRNHLDVNYYRPILQTLTVWVTSQDIVTSSLAAHSLERLFTTREASQAGVLGKQTPLRVTSQMMESIIAALLQNICQRLTSVKKPNVYLMAVLMRLTVNYAECCKPYVGDIVQSTAAVLTEAAKNPSSPQFSHAMFEVLGACIVMSPELVTPIEGALWGIMIKILAEDVTEYIPYVLQLMSAMLDARSPGEGLPEYYQSIVAPLLSPELLKQRGNIPAMSRMLGAVIRRDPAYLHNNNHTERIMAIIHELLYYKMHDHDALSILSSVVQVYPYDAIAPYMTQMYRDLFTRIQRSNTPKYTRCLIIYFSISIVTLGVETVVNGVNSVQQGLFWMYLNKVWLPSMQKVTGTVERTCCIVALANLLTQCQPLQQENEVWGHCVLQCLKMIHLGAEEDDRKSFIPKQLSYEELKDTVGDGGFSNSFVLLTSVAAPPINPCPQVTNANAYFTSTLKSFLSSSPNAADFQRLLSGVLNPQQMALLN